MKVRKNQPVSGVTFNFAQYQEFPRPAFTDKLRFPDDVTRLDAQNVSELLGKYTQLYAYANAQACEYSVRILRLETKERLIRMSLLRQQPALNSQERWRRDTVLDCDAEVVELTARIASAKAEKQIAEMARDNFEKYMAALSRELSRKGFEHRT